MTGGRPMSDQEPIESSITPLISIVTFGGRIFARAMSRISIEGALDEIPRDGPLIIAANHASNLDAVVLGAWLIPRLGRRIHWLGKRELFDWPIVGWVAANGGVHPVDRGAADVEAFRLASRILDEGHVLFVFPEGTRSPDGALQEARDGVALLASGPAPPSCRSGSAARTGSGRRASASPIRAGMSWCGSGARSARPTSCRPERTGGAAKGLVTRLIMERIAALLPGRQRGVYGRRQGGRTGPHAIIGPWEWSRKSASRSAPGSATAFARRSTRRRRPRPPAS